MPQTSARAVTLVFLGTLLAIAALSTPDRLAAQSITSPYRFIDGRHEAGISILNVPGNRGTMRLAPGGGVMIVPRYSIDVSGPLSLEASGFALQTNRRVRAPSSDLDAIEELGTSDVLLLGIDARLRFSLTGQRSWHHLSPFVTVGGGAYRPISQRTTEESEFPQDVRVTLGTGALGIAGAGTRVVLSDRFMLRLDLTAHFRKITTPPAFFRLEEEAGPVVSEQWLMVGGYGVGLSWRF